MDLNTVVIDPEEAAAKVAEYESVVAGERSAEDEAIAQAYRAAKRGQPLISLPRTIEAGGFFDNGLPRLAVARADALTCFCSVESRWLRDNRRSNDYVFSEERWHRNRGSIVGARTVRVAGLIRDGQYTSVSGQTIVPLVPPACRPKRPKLGRLHVLWEVEEWAHVAPADPALIRHLRGDLWTVLATWDLTALERLVLSHR